MSWSAKYFTHDEMRCNCGCGKSNMNQEFMDLMDDLRVKYGSPIIISSGFRCPNHPAEVRKTKSGAHSTGKAADVLINTAEAYKILRIALELGFKGIGVNQKGALSNRFIHLDMADADNFYRPTVWSY